MFHRCPHVQLGNKYIQPNQTSLIELKFVQITLWPIGFRVTSSRVMKTHRNHVKINSGGLNEVCLPQPAPNDWWLDLTIAN